MRSSAGGHLMILPLAWAAITDDKHYLKLSGLKQLVQGSAYRQEIVAGNLAGTLKTGERKGSYELGCRTDLLHSIQPGLRPRQR